jgi:uncharacterized protein involved in exopolysaccharide biosynthesis
VSEAFQAFEVLNFLRGRWRVIAAACGVALLLSLSVSLLLPKRYTATASIVIEPPGGSDARIATAVSPVYLESLRTYERFAASDTLFARAVERFHIGSQPIETLKRGILKVTKLRDTRILEISVTLTDPRLAQQVVEYLANETVVLSRNEGASADREVIDDASKQLVEAESRLAKARSAWTDTAAEDSTAALQSNIDADTDSLAKSGQARTEGRLSELQKSLARDSAELARRTARRQALEMDLTAAQAAFDSSAEHLHELQANAAARGERLRVIDPGIVPQRPSSPNVMLNVLSALLLALLASLLYLTVAFALEGRARQSPSEKAPLRALAR